MDSRASLVVAIVQHPPVVLDLEASLQRAAGYVDEAARSGAELVVFPETWLTCYPAWVFGMAGWGDPVAKSWYARLVEQSPVIGAPDAVDDDLGPLRTTARERGVTVVIGLNERESHESATLYNSLVTIGPDGSLANVHRKLTPTHTERIVWNAGDASGLRVVDTGFGALGGLVCWEHWHPLARYALHAQGERVHVAAWPDMTDAHRIAARSYAFEGRCFVVSAAQFLTTEDVPGELRAAYRAGVGPDAPESGLLFDGGSGVVAPDGSWAAGPLVGEPGILTATLELSRTVAENHDLDLTGSYARRDVFDLTVDRRRKSSVTWRDEA